MSSVAVAYLYHFLADVAIVRLIAIKIFNRSAALKQSINQSINQSIEQGTIQDVDFSRFMNCS